MIGRREGPNFSLSESIKLIVKNSRPSFPTATATRTQAKKKTGSQQHSKCTRASKEAKTNKSSFSVPRIVSGLP